MVPRWKRLLCQQAKVTFKAKRTEQPSSKKSRSTRVKTERPMAQTGKPGKPLRPRLLWLWPSKGGRDEPEPRGQSSELSPTMTGSPPVRQDNAQGWPRFACVNIQLHRRLACSGGATGCGFLSSMVNVTFIAAETRCCTECLRSWPSMR